MDVYELEKSENGTWSINNKTLKYRQCCITPLDAMEQFILTVDEDLERTSTATDTPLLVTSAGVIHSFSLLWCTSAQEPDVKSSTVGVSIQEYGRQVERLLNIYDIQQVVLPDNSYNMEVLL